MSLHLEHYTYSLRFRLPKVLKSDSFVLHPLFFTKPRTQLQPILASKRSRIVPSSTIQPQRPNIKQLEQQPLPQPRRSIFTLNSPIGETNGFVCKKPPHEGFRAFLKCCSLCKERLRQDKEVYMYGCLTAFCSLKWRDDQMALDRFNKKIDAERKAKWRAFLGNSNAAKQ